MTITEARAPDATAVPARQKRSDHANDGAMVVGASALLVAGLMHAAAIAAHSEHRAAVWTFLALAVVQVAVAAIALARGTARWIPGVVAVVAMLSVAGWAVAKTRGLPGIDGLDAAEPVRFADALAAALAALAGACSLKALVAPRLRIPTGVVVIAVSALAVVALPATASSITHVHETDAGAGEVAAAVPPHPFDPTKPIDLGGVDGVTPEQQARAENVLGATVQGLPQWSNPAVAEAKGFRSIHDGATGVEHYLNPEFMANATILDPDEPESLVYDTTVTPKQLVAAMYMLPPGVALAQVPDIGGALTQWHIHNNLCFDGTGAVAGLTKADGTCRRPLVKGPEQPMIHVWIVSRPCGPFAALEGLGGGQVEKGGVVACDHAHGS